MLPQSAEPKNQPGHFTSIISRTFSLDPAGCVNTANGFHGRQQMQTIDQLGPDSPDIFSAAQKEFARGLRHQYKCLLLPAFRKWEASRHSAR